MYYKGNEWNIRLDAERGILFPKIWIKIRGHESSPNDQEVTTDSRVTSMLVSALIIL